MHNIGNETKMIHKIKEYKKELLFLESVHYSCIDLSFVTDEKIMHLKRNIIRLEHLARI